MTSLQLNHVAASNFGTLCFKYLLNFYSLIKLSCTIPLDLLPLGPCEAGHKVSPPLFIIGAFASTPGPAHYTPQKSMLRSASVSAVTQQRNLFGPSARVPGPGTYESKSYITEGPKRTMSAKSTEYLKRTPGPQDYENALLKTKYASPNYTMSTKSKSYHQMTFEKNSYKPAPTSYNNQGFSKKGGVVIGNVPRMGL